MKSLRISRLSPFNSVQQINKLQKGLNCKNKDKSKDQEITSKEKFQYQSIVHPLQDATRARAAVEPGYALSYAYTNKMRVMADLCDQQGIAFIPVESMGGLHKVAIQQQEVGVSTGETHRH